MINWFDRSTRMVDAPPAHGDGQRIITELKNLTNLVEENLASNGSSSSGKSNANSLKMLLAKEMANEVELKRPPSVIARLMGLKEDLQAKESIIHHADTHIDSKAVNKAERKEHHQSIRLMTQDLQQFHEYKDVYEVCEDHSRISIFEDRTPDKLWSSENKSDQSDIVQEKFMDPKCFAMGEKLPHAKDLQEGLKIPSLNKDILLGLPEGCNSSLSRHPSRLHTNRASGFFCGVAHFPESSIIREAKKQLSERCATVTCDEIGHMAWKMSLQHVLHIRHLLGSCQEQTLLQSFHPCLITLRQMSNFQILMVKSQGRRSLIMQLIVVLRGLFIVDWITTLSVM